MARLFRFRRNRAIYRNPDEPLTPSQAEWIVRNHWEHDVLPAFRAKGMREPEKAQFIFDPAMHDSCRHFAGKILGTNKIALALELAQTPPATVVAILAHEAGHLVDDDRPGVFFFRQPAQVPHYGTTVIDILPTITTYDNRQLCKVVSLPEKGLSKHLRDWKERDRDECEHVADTLAEYALGRRIGYVGPQHCLIESLDKGVPRPDGLR